MRLLETVVGGSGAREVMFRTDCLDLPSIDAMFKLSGTPLLIILMIE